MSLALARGVCPGCGARYQAVDADYEVAVRIRADARCPDCGVAFEPLAFAGVDDVVGVDVRDRLPKGGGRKRSREVR